MYANVITIPSKGYLTISLLPPMKLQEILNEVIKAIQISNPDYDIVIKRLHLYYDMKLATFGINEERNLTSISSFHTVIYITATYTVSNCNGTSSYYRSQQTGTFLHSFAGRQALYSM